MQIDTLPSGKLEDAQQSRLMTEVGPRAAGQYAAGRPATSPRRLPIPATFHLHRGVSGSVFCLLARFCFHSVLKREPISDGSSLKNCTISRVKPRPSREGHLPRSRLPQFPQGTLSHPAWQGHLDPVPARVIRVKHVSHTQRRRDPSLSHAGARTRDPGGSPLQARWRGAGCAVGAAALPASPRSPGRPHCGDAAPGSPAVCGPRSAPCAPGQERPLPPPDSACSAGAAGPSGSEPRGGGRGWHGGHRGADPARPRTRGRGRQSPRRPGPRPAVGLGKEGSSEAQSEEARGPAGSAASLTPGDPGGPAPAACGAKPAAGFQGRLALQRQPCGAAVGLRCWVLWSPRARV